MGCYLIAKNPLKYITNERSTFLICTQKPKKTQKQFNVIIHSKHGNFKKL
jgi:hypothetical protein